MTVIRPNSISGINSITANGGDVNLFRADGTAADVTVNNITSGIITGTHYGSGANLTSLPAGQLTGTVADARLSTVSSSKLSGALPALDGSALTGVGASFGNSSVNTSGIITATAFVPTTGQLSHRNLIINGAMQIAQRGDTASVTSGYGGADRFKFDRDGATAVTLKQGGASDSPVSEGFSNCQHIDITTADTSMGSANFNILTTRLEGYNLQGIQKGTANARELTLSFYIKSTVTGT